MNATVRNIAERLLWTVVSAALAAVLAAPVVGVDAVQAAGMAALVALINGVLLVARWRLSVLPDPTTGDRTGPNG